MGERGVKSAGHNLSYFYSSLNYLRSKFLNATDRGEANPDMKNYDE